MKINYISIEDGMVETSASQFSIRRINFPVKVVIDWHSDLGILEAIDARGRCIATMISVEAFKDVHIVTDATNTPQFLIKHHDQPIEGDYYYDLTDHQQIINSNPTLNVATFSQFEPSMALGCGKGSLALLIERLSLKVLRNGQMAYKIIDNNIMARLLRNAIHIFDDDSDGLLPAWLSTPSFVMTNHRKQKIAAIKRPVRLREDAFTIDMSADMIAAIPSHHHALVWCALLDHCYIQASIEMERY